MSQTDQRKESLTRSQARLKPTPPSFLQGGLGSLSPGLHSPGLVPERGPGLMPWTLPGLSSPPEEMGWERPQGGGDLDSGSEAQCREVQHRSPPISPLRPLPCSGLDTLCSSLQGASSATENQLRWKISQIPSSLWPHLVWAVFSLFSDAGSRPPFFPHPCRQLASWEPPFFEVPVVGWGLKVKSLISLSSQRNCQKLLGWF